MAFVFGRETGEKKEVKKGGRKEAEGEGKLVFVLSRREEEEGWKGENSHLCYLEKGRGQNGSTLIPTTDLRNYYRLSLWLNERCSRVIAAASELDP